jgi:hypothetical protein
MRPARPLPPPPQTQTDKRLEIQQLWPGVFLWITPTGHWHIVTPIDRE